VPQINFNVIEVVECAMQTHSQVIKPIMLSAQPNLPPRLQVLKIKHPGKKETEPLRVFVISLLERKLH
jgi:hypothetical protein